MELILINSFLILGIHYTMMPGKIFSRIGSAVRKWGEVSKPLVGCAVCMSSVWGLLFYLAVKEYTGAEYFVQLPVHILAVAGLNRILLGVMGYVID